MAHSISCIIASLVFLSAIISFNVNIEAVPSALFVFGDSYVDTGNHDNDSVPVIYKPWRLPYGHTWPRKPSGRYSDGRVFTDYYAPYLGVANPMPYRVVKSSTYDGSTGINFAFGGSGVILPIDEIHPNVSVQINELREAISQGLVSQELVNTATVLLVISGNDYTSYQDIDPYFENIASFIVKVVEQIGVSLQALYELGFRSLAAANLGPVGCLPVFTKANNYTRCLNIFNELGAFHNLLLAFRISELQSNLPDAEFITLDFRRAFDEALQDGTKNSTVPLRSCCEGINDSTCGEVDNDGGLLYTVCSFIEDAFYWDEFHPTNATWKAISNALFNTPQNI